MTRWALASAAVVVGFLAGAVAFPRAQEHVTDTISLRPEADSKPFPLINPLPPPTAAIRPGGVYEVYFNGSLDVPGLGPRQKLFIQVSGISADGWYTVVFGDEVDNKGMTNAHVIPVEAPDLEPPPVLVWRIYYTSIAAISPNLATSGLDALTLQHWPE